MKHYFIYRKGNDSEKLMKTPMAQRKTIKYYPDSADRSCGDTDRADAD